MNSTCTTYWVRSRINELDLYYLLSTQSYQCTRPVLLTEYAVVSMHSTCTTYWVRSRINALDMYYLLSTQSYQWTRPVLLTEYAVVSMHSTCILVPITHLSRFMSASTSLEPFAGLLTHTHTQSRTLKMMLALLLSLVINDGQFYIFCSLFKYRKICTALQCKLLIYK